MADPVSWLLIEPGWKVLDRNGQELGKVEEVLGDFNADIFDGLAVRTGLLGKARYVPAERVLSIVEGEIRVDIGRDELDQLAEYEPKKP